MYLWYTHYKMQLGLWVLAHYARRMFCATPQSMPQYTGSPKKNVVGHGIDLGFWPKRENVCEHPEKLLVVHRLSRSKRLEISLEAMKLLPESYTLDIYGIEAEVGYVAEMKGLTKKLGLESRVTFHGTVPMYQLPELYIKHRFLLNMASETIDKTMLEVMTCGCYPVTTVGNARAIGIPEAPSEDTAQELASFILSHKDRLPLSAEEVYAVVQEKHSLAALIEKMDVYIRSGQ